MIRSLALLLFSVLFFVPAPCSAQIVSLPGQPQPPPAVPTAKPDPATEKKALDLIESLSEQVSNLHSATNRMRAQMTVGDLLWSRDEKQARSMFTAALAQLTARISEIDYSDPEVYQELNRINQSRQELIMRIAAHDPDLALTALRQTRLQPENASRLRGNYDFQADANLEMNVATVMLAKDTAAALKLARGTLARGVSWNVI